MVVRAERSRVDKCQKQGVSKLFVTLVTRTYAEYKAQNVTFGHAFCIVLPPNASKTLQNPSILGIQPNGYLQEAMSFPGFFYTSAF